jgi:hypothetical protein
MTYPLSYDTMTQAEALEIVQNEASSMGLGILETLQFYKANPHEFGSVERCAFNTALRGFRRLLAPAESN